MTLGNLSTTSRKCMEDILSYKGCLALKNCCCKELTVCCKKAIAFFIRTLATTFPLTSLDYVNSTY